MPNQMSTAEERYLLSHLLKKCEPLQAMVRGQRVLLVVSLGDHPRRCFRVASEILVVVSGCNMVLGSVIPMLLRKVVGLHLSGRLSRKVLSG